MDLERDLRDTLSDDRLSLPVRHDALSLLQAGLRRRRRNRFVATASAAVVLIAGGATAATLVTHTNGGPQRIFGPALSGPTPGVKPSMPAPSQDEIRWTNDAYDYRHPPAFPGTIADPSVPWCRADQLALSQEFQGVTGNIVGDVTTTNTTQSSCALQGQPAVRIESADGKTLVTSVPEPFYVDAWVQLRPGATASAHVLWAQQYCGRDAPAQLTIELPHGGGALTTPFNERPVCDSVVPTTSRLIVDGFVRDQNEDFTPEAGLQAGIDKADASVAPGATLHYRLQLQSMHAPSVTLNPCLPYRERLVDHATQHVLIEEDHLLNCGEAGDITDPQSNHDTFFDLQLVVPANAPTGDYDLLWQSVLRSVVAVDEQLVHVTAPVPPCRDGQVSASGGERAGAGGSYYDDIIFRNTSSTSCSLFGFPGVILTDGRGRAVKTDLQRGPQVGHLVVLLPGGAAAAKISGADFGPNGGATPCKPSAGVLVIAPGQHLQTLVRGAGMRCYDTVSVWPVVAGTHGSLGN